MIISLDFFYYLKFFISQVVRNVKGQKMAQNDKKTMSFIPYISENIHYMIFTYGTHV